MAATASSDLTEFLQPQHLRGRLVELVPIVRAHATDLYPSASDPEVWRYKLVERPKSVADMERLIDEVMIGPDRWPFTIRRLDGSVIGSTTLARFDWHHGSVEMGFTWLARSAWGQGFNEDSKELLLRHCFDSLLLQRVESQVDSRNHRSVAALRRLGFTYEGTLRSRHVLPDGSRRDSMMFSVIADQWASIAEHLETLIDARWSGQSTPDVASTDHALDN